MKFFRIFCLFISFILAYETFGQPKIEIVEGTKLDFGDIYSGKKLVRDVTVKNVGTDTLHITAVNAGCGCTATMLSEKNIPPGGSGKLQITFDSKGFNGRVNKYVNISSDDKKNSTVRIDFSANVIQVLSVSPTSVSFSNVKIDTTYTKTITLTNQTKNNIEILSAKPTTNDVEVSLLKMKLMPGEQTTMQVTTTPKKTGTFNGIIELKIDHPEQSKVDVRYFIWVNETTK